MKAISRKLTIGASRPSGSWLILLLLLAVLVPSVCLLWFMSKAVLNERLVVRQRLAEAYRANLSLMQNMLDAYWRQSAAALDTDADRLAPSALFSRHVRTGLYDAVVCFDAAGNVVYPGQALAPNPRRSARRGLRPNAWNWPIRR